MIEKLEIKISQASNDLQNQNIGNSPDRTNNHANQMQMEENKYQNMIGPNIQLEKPFDNSKIKQINLDNFNSELDCIDIVYSIKTLNKQVAYLLKRDEKYSKASEEAFKNKPDVYKRNLNLNQDESINKTSKVDAAPNEGSRNAQIINPSHLAYATRINPVSNTRRVDNHRPNTYLAPEDHEQVQMMRRNAYQRNNY